MFKEPPNPRSTYLQGLSLLSSQEDGEPFACRILCQFLGKTAKREDWAGKIGVFADRTFQELFENSEIIARALGGDGVMTGHNAS